MTSTPNTAESSQRAPSVEAVLIAEALRRLSEHDEPPKRAWQVFLESAGGAALITVTVGGLIAGAVAQWLTNSYQERLKERETVSAAYREYLAQGSSVVIDAFSTMGTVMAASDDLLTITRPEFNDSNFTGAGRKLWEAEREKIRTVYNEAEARWASRRDSSTLLIAYYHDGRPEVVASWQRVQIVMRLQ